MKLGKNRLFVCCSLLFDGDRIITISISEIIMGLPSAESQKVTGAHYLLYTL